MHPQTFRLLGIVILLSLALAPVSSPGVRASGDAQATEQPRAKLPWNPLAESPFNNPSLPLTAQGDAETRTQMKDTLDQLGFTADEAVVALRDTMLRRRLTNAETLLPHTAPTAHYQIAGERLAVDAAFKLYGDRSYGLGVGRYDDSHPLVIESQLRYSTFLGGSVNDIPSAIALDGAGNVYLTGITGSDDFPTTAGAYEERYYGRGPFVSALDPTLTSLRYLYIDSPSESRLTPRTWYDRLGRKELACMRY